MLRKGAWILSAWCVLCALPCMGSLVFIALGKHAPGLRMRFTVQEIPQLDARTLATVDGFATLLNSLIIIYCASIFFLIRRSLLKGERWSVFVVAVGTGLIQIICYLSDHFFFLGKNTLTLNLSSAVLLLGFGFVYRQYSSDRRAACPRDR